MAIVIAFPVLILLAMLQMVVVSRLPLLLGTADLIMLALAAWALQERVKQAWVWTIIGGAFISYVSALPFVVPFIGYLLVTALSRLLQKRVWQTPILAMFVATFLGTLITQGLAVVALEVNGIALNIQDAVRLVMLPSLLLNLILALPMRAIMVNLAEWVYPVEIQL